MNEPNEEERNQNDIDNEIYGFHTTMMGCDECGKQHCSC